MDSFSDTEDEALSSSRPVPAEDGTVTISRGTDVNMDNFSVNTTSSPPASANTAAVDSIMPVSSNVRNAQRQSMSSAAYALLFCLECRTQRESRVKRGASMVLPRVGAGMSNRLRGVKRRHSSYWSEPASDGTQLPASVVGLVRADARGILIETHNGNSTEIGATEFKNALDACFGHREFCSQFLNKGNFIVNHDSERATSYCLLDGVCDKINIGECRLNCDSRTNADICICMDLEHSSLLGNCAYLHHGFPGFCHLDHSYNCKDSSCTCCCCVGLHSNKENCTDLESYLCDRYDRSLITSYYDTPMQLVHLRTTIGTIVSDFSSAPLFEAEGLAQEFVDTTTTSFAEPCHHCRNKEPCRDWKLKTRDTTTPTAPMAVTSLNESPNKPQSFAESNGSRTKDNNRPEDTKSKENAKNCLDSAYASLERQLTPSTQFLYGDISPNEAIKIEAVLTSSLSEQEPEVDSGNEECSTSDSDDTVIYLDSEENTKEKLNQRTTDMLAILKDQYVKLIQDISEQLVHLLQVRHELREQVEMRKIAVEQLVRYQTDTKPAESESVQMGIVVSGDA